MLFRSPKCANGGPESGGSLKLFALDQHFGTLTGMQAGAIQPIDDGILSRQAWAEQQQAATADRDAQCEQPADFLVGNSHLGGFSEEYLAGKAR